MIYISLLYSLLWCRWIKQLLTIIYSSLSCGHTVVHVARVGSENVDMNTYKNKMSKHSKYRSRSVHHNHIWHNLFGMKMKLPINNRFWPSNTSMYNDNKIIIQSQINPFVSSLHRTRHTPFVGDSEWAWLKPLHTARLIRTSDDVYDDVSAQADRKCVGFSITSSCSSLPGSSSSSSSSFYCF